MFKLILIFLFIQRSLCERSFTLVVDTTESMKDEIYAIKANIGRVVNAVNNNSDFNTFVFVAFKDTGVDPPFTTKSAREFMSRVNTLRTSGGLDCPENSLAGIEAALRASEQQSTIFVFTDAFSKDYNNFRAVETLCKENHSQVMIFLSGYCQTSPLGNVEVYYDVAKACTGAVFTFSTIVELRETFKYMKEIINTDWSNVTTYKTVDFKEISFLADSFTTDFMIAISGARPALQILALNSQAIRMESVFETKESLVICLRYPDVGEYKAIIRGQGPISVTFYERNYVPFQFGFSTKSPRNIKETSPRPIAGTTNYLLINVDNLIKLRSVEWLNLGESVKQILLLRQITSGSYVTSVFVEPGKMFRFWIIGEETSAEHEVKGSSKVIAPQRSVYENEIQPSMPEVEILDSELGLIDFGTDLTLACRVVGYPQPKISWSNKENTMQYTQETVLLEIPSVFISYVTLTNVENNFTVVCNSWNSEGSVNKSIDVYVNRTFTFDIIQEPKDASVEYGTEHYINCQVEAYPDATIKWYLNGSLIDTFFNSRVSLKDNALVIKKMDFQDIGDYNCKAFNDVQSEILKASITISGVEAPKIEASETEINLKRGDWTQVECRVIKGKPAPEISWKYKALETEDFKYLPDGVLNDDGTLEITKVEKAHAGVYRCIASNAMGEDTRDFNIKIQTPPKIINSASEDIVVKEGKEVHLFCEVDATPEAIVRWEKSQEDVNITMDKRFRTDDKHTLSFTAFFNDSGNYHCVAENSVGKAERTVFVNVLVMPFIEPPKSDVIYANIGGSITLTCNVLYGNPAPTIRWEFIAEDSASSTLNRDDSSSMLRLSNLSQSNEGSYLCIAENHFSTDRIIYKLKVQ